MISKLEILKTLFTEYLREKKGMTIVHSSKNEKTHLNSEVYEFQSFIAESLKAESINLKINPYFYSEKIKNSFSNTLEAFTPSDYLFSFFEFLNIKKKCNIELYSLIDQFINLHKTEMSWKDIEITSSGATRCMTNIRFALNHLRDIGLIEKKNNKNKSSFKPTSLGEMVFYYDRKTQGKQFWKPESTYEEVDFNPALRNRSYANFYKILKGVLSENKNNDFVNDYLDYYKKEHEKEILLKSLNNLHVLMEKATISETGIR